MRTQRKFYNEYHREIEVSVSVSREGDAPEQIKLVVEGPNSITEHIVTRMEAEQINRALSEALSY